MKNSPKTCKESLQLGLLSLINALAKILDLDELYFQEAVTDLQFRPRRKKPRYQECEHCAGVRISILDECPICHRAIFSNQSANPPEVFSSMVKKLKPIAKRGKT